VPYIPGDNWCICDITGRKILQSQTRKTWDGYRVAPDVWYSKNPQEDLRAIPERSRVRDARPRQADVYQTATYGYGSFCLISPDGTNYTTTVVDPAVLTTTAATWGTPQLVFYVDQYSITVDNSGNLVVTNIGEKKGPPSWRMTSSDDTDYDLTVTSDLDIILSYVDDEDVYFTTTWKTDNAGTSNADQITLPLQSSGTYDFYVDWGDGGERDRITSYNESDVTHTFAGGAGTYTVKIWGSIKGWYFNNGGDRRKILTVEAWGPLRLGNTGYYFYGCSNLTIPATDTLDMTGTTYMAYAFQGCSSLATFPSLLTLDTSSVTNMWAMFMSCTLFNDSVANFDTSSVLTMNNMFSSCPAFNQSVANFDTSEVRDMNSIFSGCTTFNQSVDNFDTSNVANFSFMFRTCSAFNQSVANFNTSSATSMQSMFRYCTVFDQDLSGFDITSLTGATALQTILEDTAFSTTNYDLLLVSWEAQAPATGINFHAGSAKYTAGGAVEAARTSLVGTYTWSITDDGPV